MEHFKTDEKTSPKSQNTGLQKSVQSLDAQPMLSIPKSILDKYRAPSVPAKSSGQAEKVQDKVNESSDFQISQEEQQLTITDPATVQLSPRKRAVKIVNFPYNISIPWVINDHNPIFDDDQDAGAARQFNHLHFNANRTFWAHPVRYLPEVTEQNAYRTIMIDFIPLGSTYKDVLGSIRGGMLESIQLLPPLGRSTNFMTARVVFVYEAAARNMYMEDQHMGIFIRGQLVRVWQVLQPTYPRSVVLQEDIDAGYTRNLMIWEATENQNARLLTKLARQVQTGTLVDDWTSHDGKRVLELCVRS